MDIVIREATPEEAAPLEAVLDRLTEEEASRSMDTTPKPTPPPKRNFAQAVAASRKGRTALRELTTNVGASLDSATREKLEKIR